MRLPDQLFDPLGLTIPVFIPVSSLFQDLCRKERDWDTPLEEAGKSVLERWVRDLEGINIELARCYLQPNEPVEHCYLNVFGDASEKAYCAVVYLSQKTALGWDSTLLCSKARLSPLSENKTSIPRLELLAALISARQITAVKEALSPVLSVYGIFCWSDSKVVLWIQADRDYKQFVFNRRKEIVSLTGVESWKHCAGTENPADLGSRGCFATTLVTDEIWWKGPPWLRGSPEAYPARMALEIEQEVLEKCDRKVKVQSKIATTLVAARGNKESQLSAVIDVRRFNNWNKLLY